MTRYLLDTNHLSAYLDAKHPLKVRVESALRTGDRVGICLPVLCEYNAGIRLGRHYQRNLSRLQHALNAIRMWPMDEETAAEFASLFQELRAAGKALSQFDLLIAALARQRRLTILSSDNDFAAVARVKIENWI